MRTTIPPLLFSFLWGTILGRAAGSSGPFFWIAVALCAVGMFLLILNAVRSDRAVMHHLANAWESGLAAGRLRSESTANPYKSSDD